MARKKTVQQHLKNIKIVDAGAKGKSIAKTDDGHVILVPYGVPGDVVDIALTKKRKSFREGIITAIHQPSKDRVSPKCENFGICGGCKWQQMDYQKQLFYKQKEVENNLKRIGKIKTEPLPIVGCGEAFHYRNKMEFSFSNNRWLTKQELEFLESIEQRNALGFHVSGMWDKVLDIDNCYLHTTLSNDILKGVKNYALENNLSFFDYKKKKGLLRNLMIRINAKGEAMVLIQFYDDEKDDREKLLNYLKNTYPNIQSLLYVNNTKLNDTIYNLNIIVFSGESFIWEHIGNYQFKISAKSFFQTNTKQTELLYNIIIDFAELSGKEVVYDLYSGTGSIAIYLSKQSKKIIGIETVKDAVLNAKENAQLNGIENISFLLGDVKDALSEDIIKKDPPDVIVVDPPREGLHKNVIKKLLEIGSPKVVYVSCNSATQARDLDLLSEKYIVEKTQAVDMFPHTHHVENVVLLSSK